jgi:hypothetical protein
MAELTIAIATTTAIALAKALAIALTLAIALALFFLSIPPTPELVAAIRRTNLSAVWVFIADAHDAWLVKGEAFVRAQARKTDGDDVVARVVLHNPHEFVGATISTKQLHARGTAGTIL